jgi:hypothetical protein
MRSSTITMIGVSSSGIVSVVVVLPLPPREGLLYEADVVRARNSSD